MTPEQTKLYHATYKHLTTLSVAGIVFISALLIAGRTTRGDTLFPLLSLILSNLVSIQMMFGLAEDDLSPKTVSRANIAAMFLWALAVGGLAYAGWKHVGKTLVSQQY